LNHLTVFSLLNHLTVPSAILALLVLKFRALAPDIAPTRSVPDAGWEAIRVRSTPPDEKSNGGRLPRLAQMGEGLRQVE